MGIRHGIADIIGKQLKAANAASASAVSDKLVQLVDIVFAVVIAQSLAKYSDRIVNLSPPRTLVALLVVYIATVSSWWAYHRSMKRYPYKDHLFGTLRWLVDLFTVVLYVYLLYSVAEIETTDNVVPYVSGFPFVFAAYIVAGLLRRLEYNPQASRLTLLFGGGTGLGACAIAYHVLYSSRPSEATDWNWLFIILPAVVVLAFRMLRYRLYEGDAE